MRHRYKAQAKRYVTLICLYYIQWLRVTTGRVLTCSQLVVANLYFAKFAVVQELMYHLRILETFLQSDCLRAVVFHLNLFKFPHGVGISDFSSSRI